MPGNSIYTSRSRNNLTIGSADEWAAHNRALAERLIAAAGRVAGRRAGRCVAAPAHRRAFAVTLLVGFLTTPLRLAG